MKSLKPYLFSLLIYFNSTIIFGFADPQLTWNIIKTDRFHVYYSKEKEAWTRLMLADLEKHAEKLEKMVGHKPQAPVDIIVSDVFSLANGFAIPAQYKNRIVLYTTAPTADSFIGSSPSWASLVALHEYAHVVHLGRSHRESLKSSIGSYVYMFDINPNPVPQWVSEGYATYIEGQITGRGRPHNDLIASTLRQFALQGSLPNWQELNSLSTEGWLGGNMNYLIGSSFFLWLDQKFGAEKIPQVWTRMTQKKNWFSSFSANSKNSDIENDTEESDLEKAFNDIYGLPIKNLYSRFTVEIYWAALETEKLLPTSKKEETWQSFSNTPTRPSLSPNGNLLALVLKSPKRIDQLKIYENIENKKGFAEWQEAEDDIIKNDPQNAHAIKPNSTAREAKYELSFGDDLPISSPSWVGNQNKILLTKVNQDSKNFLFNDIYLWDLDSNKVEALSKMQKLDRANAGGDGSKIVALRSENGYSEIVTIDTKTKELNTLINPTLNKIYDQPMINPNNKNMAFLEHHNGNWSIQIFDFQTKIQKLLFESKNGQYLSDISWNENGEEIYFSAGENGFVNIYKINLKSSETQAITQNSTPYFNPIIIPKSNALFAKKISKYGFNIVKLDSTPVENKIKNIDIKYHTVTLKNSTSQLETSTKAFDKEAESSLLTPQKLSFFYGAGYNQHSIFYDLGLKGGDIIGRWDWQIGTSFSQDKRNDNSLAILTWKGWPFHLRGGYLHQVSNPNMDDDLKLELPEEWNESRQGWLAGTNWDAQFDFLSLDLRYNHVALDYKKKNKELVENEKNSRVWDAINGALKLHRYFNEWKIQLESAGTALKGNFSEEKIEKIDQKYTLAISNHGFDLYGSQSQSKSLSKSKNVDTLIRLGGMQSSFNDEVTNPMQKFDPSLTEGVLIGSLYQQQEFGILFSKFFDIFYRKHRVAMSYKEWSDWLHVSGLQVNIGIDGLPLPELRGVQITAGIAKIHSDALHHRDRFWLGMRYGW